MIFSHRIRLLLSCLCFIFWLTQLVIPHSTAVFSQVFTEIASRAWPAAEAKIVSRTVYDLRGGRGSGADRFRYGAHIWFEYTVDGVTFSGNSDVADETEIAVSRRELEERFAVGTTLRVHYRPGEPYRHIQVPGLRWTTFLDVLLVCVNFFCVGIVVSSLVKSFRKYRGAGDGSTASPSGAASGPAATA